MKNLLFIFPLAILIALSVSPAWSQRGIKNKKEEKREERKTPPAD